MRLLVLTPDLSSAIEVLAPDALRGALDNPAWIGLSLAWCAAEGVYPGAAAPAGVDVIDRLDPATWVPPTVETLAAYARRRSKEMETGGVTFAGMRLDTDRTSQGLIDRAVALFAANPLLTSVEFDTGEAEVTLDKDTMTAIGVTVGMHVQGCFARRVAALRAIRAGTATTTADVDAILAGTP